MGSASARSWRMAAILVAALPSVALGAENGAGFYLLGGRGPMAGYVPPPGFYLQNDIYGYSASGGGSRSFPAGGKIIADVDATIWADFVTGTWVLPADILGGNLAIGAIVPFGEPSVAADILVDPALFDPIGARVSDSTFLFGDPVASAILGWHAGNWHWNLTGLVNIPVGDYREGAIANLAFHRWAGDISGGLTWFDPASGIDLSATAGFTLNGTNPATDYTTGTEFHVEWAATKALGRQWSLGLVGYHYQQITGDSGEGATLGPYEGRVTALGGTVAYNFEAAGTPVSARIKLYREFDAENRLEGTSGFFTVAFPIGAGK